MQDAIGRLKTCVQSLMDSPQILIYVPRKEVGRGLISIEDSVVNKRNHVSTMPLVFPFFWSIFRHSFNQAQYVQHKQILTNLQTINRYSATGQNETNQRLTLPTGTSYQILIHYSKLTVFTF